MHRSLLCAVLRYLLQDLGAGSGKLQLTMFRTFPRLRRPLEALSAIASRRRRPLPRLAMGGPAAVVCQLLCYEWCQSRYGASFARQISSR